MTIEVTNPDPTITVPSVTVSGNGAIFLTCAGNLTTDQYSQTITNLMPGEMRRVTISKLTTGEWNHAISAGVLQNQHQRGIVLVSSSANATVKWTVFPAVITVNSAGEGFSQCLINQTSTTCKLRDAFAQAIQHNSYPGEQWLIQLAVSPGTLSGGSLIFDANLGDYTTTASITLDGTDASGNPWIVGDANAAAAGDQSPFTNVVDFHNSGGFVFRTSNNTIQGLAIKNTVPSGQMQATYLVSVQNFSPGQSYPQNNLLRSVQIDGGNRLDCGCPAPSCGCSPPIDLINVDEAGVLPPPQPSLTVVNVEGFAGLDKGVKAADNGSVVVNDSWIHHNYRGGIQATFSTTGNSAGIVTVNRNVIENSGLRYINGSPPPGPGTPTPTPDNHQVDSAANGLASHAAGSTLTSSGNVSQINFQHGAIVDNTSSLKETNDYLCGNGTNGVAASAGGSPTVFGQGIAAAYNNSYGVALASFSQADFGGGPLGSSGNNAFVQNASGCDFQNLATAVNAEKDQWTNGSPRTCGSGTVNTAPVQKGNDPNTLGVSSTFPGNAFLPGQTIRIYGSGFNADGGNPAPSGGCVGGMDAFKSCCLTVANNNTCSGTHTPPPPPTPGSSGNCVEYQSSAGTITQLTVTAVTPAMAVAAVPGNSS
ncbi:MAG: hypothetical protein ACHQ4J_00250 [Candidatus Binatia bacterium]